VHWSTGEVYGYNMADKKYLPPNEEMTEEYAHITPGEAPYAKTKWLQEQLVWKYHKEQGLPVISLRLGTVYGEGPFFARLINIFADLSGLGLFPKSVNFKWPLVHVDDVAGAALHLSKRKSAVGQVYNIVDDQNYTISDIVYAVAEYFSKELKDIKFPPLSKLWSTIPRGDFVMDIVRAAYKSLTDELKKKGKKVWFDYDHAVAYVELILGMEEFADNFRLSNRKLKETGYKLRCSDIREALPGLMDSFRKGGFLVENPGLKHLLTKGLAF
jgi:nucleoside-diphosphate-sugar epimerase